MITGPIATIIAAGIAAAVAFFGSIAMIYYRLGKLEQAVESNKQGIQSNRELVLSESARLSDKIDAESARLSDKIDAESARLSDKMDAQHAETMSAIQRLFDALVSHSHDPELGIVFRAPPGNGSGTAPQPAEELEDSPA